MLYGERALWKRTPQIEIFCEVTLGVSGRSMAHHVADHAELVTTCWCFANLYRPTLFRSVAPRAAAL